MAEAKDITFEIQRKDPDNGNEPYWDEYEVECEPMDRVLDALQTIRGEKDGSLAFRKSCAHGVCGSDAMNINGQNRLACQTLLDDLGFPNTVTIRPLPAMDTIKDLVVDMERFEQKMKSIKPYQIEKSKMPADGERKQSPEEQKLIEESTTCIQCGACTSSCPSSWNNPDYIGPAAMLKAYRYTFDSRDEGADERLEALDVSDGLWRCHTIFNCVEACPKDINLTWHISELKKAATDREL